MGRKHFRKRRNCSLRAMSHFPTVFSKDLYCRHVETGYVFTSHFQKHFMSFSPDYVNLIVTRVLICLAIPILFSKSEVVLQSNTSKYRKILKTRVRTFLRMVGEYGHRTCVGGRVKQITHVCEKIFPGKGENAGYQHFLLFPKCFRKLFNIRVVKSQDHVVKSNMGVYGVISRTKIIRTEQNTEGT